MLAIDKDFVFKEEYRILLSQRQIVYKIKSPVFEPLNWSGVPFQGKLVGYHNQTSEEAVVVFAMIPQ